jgi:hypothetical protein
MTWLKGKSLSADSKTDKLKMPLWFRMYNKTSNRDQVGIPLEYRFFQISLTSTTDAIQDGLEVLVLR